MGVDPGFWRGRRVLLTGHTGFKGSWLSLWLQELGAQVVGLSVDIPTSPSLYELAGLERSMEWIRADVRDHDAVRAAIDRAAPEIVIHMAAQALVRRSFAQPRETYETNVMGTVNVLEAARGRDELRVLVNVTSDKCYENREWERGYREGDALGGSDPYSSSKGAAELVTDAYRRSFFAGPEATRIVSARAGNVIGGGDWSEDRLVPDLIKAVLAGATLRVRNPTAVRPWQHVLNPLSGYLVLAQAAWEDPAIAGAWNFGPPDDDARQVGWVVEQLAARWPGGVHWERDEGDAPHEAHYLKLDSSHARSSLGWQPAWSLEPALDATVSWYRSYADSGDLRALTLAQIGEFSAV
ncbi:MAG TPA: CDP-glucose 4,6-dehydratase [Solirubrobacteraceae bacterium]|nr:CDP-glucose 4,6-dehydratase [Solirubrobacteraceae bacterium]